MKVKNSKRVVIIALLVLLQLAISSLAPFLSGALDSYLKVAAVKLIYALSYFVPYVLYRKMFKPIASSHIKHTFCEYKRPLFFVGFAAMVAFLQINIVLLEFVDPPSVSSVGVFDGVLGFAFSIVMYAVLPAITEELFSRGVIMRLGGFGMKAALLSGVIFGLCHFNPYKLVYTVGSGIVLSLIYLYSNDIKLSVYLHLAVNSTVLLLSYLAMAVPAGVYVAIECIVWLVVLGIGVYCCWILLRDRGVEIHQKTKEIRKIDKDISVGEIFSPAMIVVYVAILAATVIRYI